MTSNLNQITLNNTDFAEVVGVNTEDHMLRIARRKHCCPKQLLALSGLTDTVGG